MAIELTTEVTAKGVTERDFTLSVGEGEPVPGVLWTPEGATGSRPTILIGHGGTTHKRVDYVVTLARRLVRHLGYAAVAIDAPEHGDRISDPEAAKAARKGLENRIAGGKDAPVGMDVEALKRMGRIARQGVQDWHATLDAVATIDGVGEGPYGWWGVSMGTTIGLPFVAQEPRISAAVLGLNGALPGTRYGDQMLEQAASLTIPVLFLYQWHDELMTRESGLALFDAIGSKDKSMHINPGGHVAMPGHERDAAEAFFTRHLGSS